MGACSVPKVSEAVRNWLILQNRRHAGGPNTPRITGGIRSAARPARERIGVRPAELPYDQLFAAAGEPVLIVEAATECIVEANPAAAVLLRSTRPALVGERLTEAFVASGAVSLRSALSRACRHGNSNLRSVRTRDGSAELSATLSLFRTGAESYVLVRLQAPPSAVRQIRPGHSRSKVFDAIDTASVGFVMTDSSFKVEYANPAFVEMVELTSVDEVLGKALVHWLELSGENLARLSEQMSQREAVTVLTTRLRSDQKRSCDVEVTAVAVPDQENACWGFSIRQRPILN
jgi:PAS domain-containing protein